MKRISIFIVFPLMFLGSCDEEKTNIDLSKNAFSYTEIISYDDYAVGGNMIIYDIDHDQTHVIDVGEISSEVQWMNSEMFYISGSTYMKYSPTSRKEELIVELPNELMYEAQLSPNQKYLACSNGSEVYIIDIDEGTTEQITDGLVGDFRIPKWSNNSTQLLLRNKISKRREGDSYNTATANFKVYSLDEQRFQDVEMFDEFASPGVADWSTDGNSIVYEQFQTIFLFDLKTEELARITNQDTNASFPVFSRDGKRIAYLSSDANTGSGNWQDYLTIYSLDNKTHQVINEVNSYFPCWDAGSKRILYASENGIHTFELETENDALLVSSNSSTYYFNMSWLN